MKNCYCCGGVDSFGSMIGVFYFDDGVGVFGYVGIGYDVLGGFGVERLVGGRFGGYVIGDWECDRGVYSGFGYVGVMYCEFVYCRVGEWWYC